MITTQRELRQIFWRTFPQLSRKKIKDYTGIGTMYCTDTRCTFVEWIDGLKKSGDISQELAERATL